MSGPATVPGLLENAATGHGVVSFLGREREDVRFGELWTRSERAAAYFREALGHDAVVGLLMETSLDCLVTLLGALRAGITTLSLPYPARSTPVDEYRRELLDIGRLAGAQLLVLPDGLAGLDLEGGLAAVSFRECTAHPRRADAADPGEFVQFSSGSTGKAKGVRLSSSAIAANVTAIIEHLAPWSEGATTCSWLPLSHDMGLIGMCLATLAAMAPPWSARQLVLVPPERIVARPSRWLQACSELGATVPPRPTSPSISCSPIPGRCRRASTSAHCRC